MIKINLFPVRAALKKENIRRQVSIFFLCIVLSVCLMAYITISMRRTISNLNRDIASTQADLEKYEAIAKQVNKMKQDLKRLEEKMDIIVQLEANRTGPVRFMDALTEVVVADKMWLTSLTESGGNMELKGMATDNKIVADFMTRLEKLPIFGTVDLISSMQIRERQDKKFKQFIITCRMIQGQPKTKPKTS
jgi:type IV pilus assembly protein PilN